MILRWLTLLLSCGLAAQEYNYREYSGAAGLPDNRVEQVVTDSTGFVYARTALGWLRFDGQQFEDITGLPPGVSDRMYLTEAELAAISQRYLEDTPYAGTELLDLAEDAEGRRWFATAGRGLLRQLPSSFTRYATGEGRVTALLDHRDTLYVGTDGRGLFRLVDDGLRPVPGWTDLEGLQITDLAHDDRFLYVATAGRGVYVRGRDTLFHLRQTDGLPSNWIRELALADSSLAILTTAGEVSRWTVTDSSLLLRDDPLNLPDLQYAHLVSLDTARLLFTATAGEVALHTGEGFVAVTAPAEVANVSFRRGSQLWFTLSDGGVLYTDLNVSPFRYGRVPAKLLGTAARFGAIYAAGDERQVWYGTDRGLSRLFLDANGQPLFARHYGVAEGFPAGEQPSEAITATSDGRLWIGTATGLLRFTGRGGDNYRRPPPTMLEAVTLFYDTIVPGRTEFRARENHLGFRYRAVDLSYPENVRYRYRLSPLLPAWSPVTEETSVRYAGLPGGRYTFTVAATTDGGNTWGPPTRYAFTIESPLLLRPGVLIGGVILIALLLIAGLYTYQRRQVRRRATAYAELERQNRLLRLEQQARQLQMNPHFLFNALNAIRGMVKGAGAREEISRFAGLMRGILHNSRQERITLAEEIHTLEQYLRMEQFCHPDTFTYRIHLPEGVDPEEVSLPPMLLQPFVENAIRHGFSGLERPGELTVSIAVNGRRGSVRIEDNGVGRAAAARRREGSATAHRSVALEVTRQRIDALGGQLHLTDGPEYGTIVELEIPVAYDW